MGDYTYTPARFDACTTNEAFQPSTTRIVNQSVLCSLEAAYCVQLVLTDLGLGPW
jgi:hypothetical protein